MSSDVAINPVSGVDLTIDASGTWPFADANRAAAGAHFTSLQAALPTLFNGPTYMLVEHGREGGRAYGRAVRTDYASFLYWRHRGFADSTVKNTFGVAALHGSDGGLLLGVMADHTSNAGRIYPPSGSFDDSDVRDGRLDVIGNIRREVAEETGLEIDTARAHGWLAIDDGPRLAFVRRFDWPVPASDLARRIEAVLACQERPELAGLHLVQGTRDIVSSRMPPFTIAYIEHVFGR